MVAAVRPWRPLRARPRYAHHRQQLHVAELVEHVVRTHKLTDAMREYRVYVFWKELFDAKVASNTTPVSLSKGVLSVHARSSTWLQELRFLRERMLGQIQQLVGGSDLITDLRFSLDRPSRGEPVDHELLPRLRREEAARRPSPRQATPATADDREAIRAQTSTIEDDELRAIVERVRVEWNI